MQNAECRIRSGAILHSAFCILHSRQRHERRNSSTNPHPQRPPRRGPELSLTLPRPGNRGRACDDRFVTAAKNAECRMQNAELEAEQFCILHFAFCIRDNDMKDETLQRIPTLKDRLAAVRSYL